MERLDQDLKSKLRLQENPCQITRPYKCTSCQLTFDRASQYDYHHRSIHLKEKCQLCEICGKSFFRKTDLQTHLNIHLKNNLCICEICGRSFNHISNLIRHSRIHAGVKPYPCSICGKRFNQINSLSRHKRVHERSADKAREDNKTEEERDSVVNKESVEGTLTERKIIKRQHYCKVCGESFALILLLRQHEKLHEETTSASKFCTKKLSDPDEHQLGVTPNEVEGKTLDDSASKHSTDLCYNNDLQQVVPLENIIYISSEEPSAINDIHLLLYKSNEIAVADNLLCMEANRNGITILPENAGQHVNLERKESEETGEKSVGYGALRLGPNDPLNTEECPLISDAVTEKPNETSHCNIAVDVPVNVNHVLCKSELEVKWNDQKGAKDARPLDKIVQYQEPMLRLVQTENGEQFYEFIISNMVEKSADTGSVCKGRVQESTSNFKSKSSEPDELQRFANLAEPSFLQHDLQSIDRIYSTLSHDSLFCTTPRKKEEFADRKAGGSVEVLHHELLASDVQSDFERYVETNFEVFEKLSYGNSSEQFPELTEIVECHSEVSQYVEASSFAQNEREQLFELLQVSQSDKNQSQCFDQIDYVQETVSPNDNEVREASATTDSKGAQELTASSEISNPQSEETGSKNSTTEVPKAKKKSVKFQCMECEKSFSSSYNYKQHIGTHFADQQKFHCKDCGLSFAWKTTLNKHMANYHRPDGPQRFVCSLCPKVYGTSSQVNEHVKRDHWKHLNHTCSQCGKCFFKKYDLKIHSRTHTGERPYVCRSCGKRFHHRSHIIRHEQIHV